MSVFAAFFLVVQVISVTLVGTAPASAVTAGPIVATNSGLCIEPEGGSTNVNVRIVQDNCDGSEVQSYEMRNTGGGLVELYNRGSEKCLHVTNASTEPAAEILLFDCNGSTNSLYRVAEVAGGITLTVQHTAMCLDINSGSTAAGATLIQWPCHGRSNQTFDWQSVDTADDTTTDTATGGDDSADNDGTGGADDDTIVNNATVCSTTLTVEAESGELTGSMVAASSAGASGGQYVHAPDGSGNNYSGPGSSAASYCFTVATAGDYRIEISGQGVDGQSDSFFVTVDGQPTEGYLYDLGVSSSFVTSNVSDRGGENPVVVNLSAGDHTLAFYNREDGTRLDTITLVPTGGGSGGGGGGGECVDGLTAEAETGLLAGAMTVVAGGSASGGQYIHTPEDAGDQWNGAPSTDRATYCFNVDTAGQYRIETRIQGLDNLSDSFYVTVDGQPVDGYLYDTPVSGAFVASNVSNRGGADPVVVDLSVGEHTIVFHKREDGTRLDTITLVPTGGGGGGGGTGECVDGLTAEAETALLAGAMTVVSSGAASGGQYVHTPEDAGDQWDGATAADTATFCFNVDTAGEYRIETQTQGLDGLSDSFYVTVDGQPSGGYLFDLGVSSSFSARNVSDRNGDNPVLVDLSAGEHTIVFHKREDGSRLDSVTLVSTGGGGGGGQNTTGAWGPVQNVGLVPVAMANIPNGEVLMWSAYANLTFGGDNGYTQTVIYNPDTGGLRARQVGNTQHDMFCPGIANMPDGRVMVTGGSGNAETSIYNPATDSWQDAADLIIGRGYHANVTLGDGSVLAMGGSWSGGIAVKDSEIYRNGSWTRLPGIRGGGSLLTADAQGQYRSDNHMWLFAWTGNRVFHAGPARTMHWIDPAGQGSIQAVGTRGSDGHAMNGNAVMYDVGKILTTGGAPNYMNDRGTANAHVIDLNAGGTVRQVQSLNNSRTLHSSVVLPSGEVVAVGGQAISRLFTDDEAVMTPELFNPDTETWSELAPMSVPRTYHSAGLLLDDGRVLVGGGGLCGNCSGFPERNHPDVQILTPPYLLDAAGNLKTRPVINSAPGSAGYGGNITVNVSGGASEFALVRLANSTHATNNAQRRIPVSFTSSGGGNYQLSIPSDPGVAPPGAYMLFAMDASGTPSVSTSVLLN